MNIKDIFDNREFRRSSRERARNYDVGVSLINCGHDARQVVRIGFINKAKKAFEGKAYIQPSNVEKYPFAMYFKLYEEKEYADCYKLGNHTPTAFETKFTPNIEQRRIIEKYFVGHHTLKFDVENQMYFIEAFDEQQKQG